MTKQEQVKAIFIEEAGEIIEKLDVNIIRFEENSNDFELLNEIFRGVHTLKGNANAFGFTRLGEFVHHFEDVLDYYRSTKESIEDDNLELFVESVDVIKEVMRCELDAISELPQSYSECLEKIKKLLTLKKNKSEPLTIQNSSESFKDLASEFGEMDLPQKEDALQKSIKEQQSKLMEGLYLYKIELSLDSDCYKRGFDYFIFLKILGEKANSLESFFE
ncbi:MAG: two-component system, chemotaxis family, sensor kinase CheA, partial [Campylobacterota bacterium]|nr:two-component system, chemotaxis family, sensor kinase CheA [Campylobacterota bacterium]